MSGRLFRERPRDLSRADFVTAHGRVYEHSPWIAEHLFDAGLTPAHDSLDGLADALRQIVEAGGEARQLALLRAHPDLAGKLAIAGKLTTESSSEQAGAGLDRCSPEEFAAFQAQVDAVEDRHFHAAPSVHLADLVDRYDATVVTHVGPPLG